MKQIKRIPVSHLYKLYLGQKVEVNDLNLNIIEIDFENGTITLGILEETD